MKKYLLIAAIAMIVGCTPCPPLRDQLMLEVPIELMETPKPLVQIEELPTQTHPH